MSNPSEPNGEPSAAANGHGGEFVETLPGADDDFGLAPRPRKGPRQRSRAPDPLVGLDLGGVRIERLIGEGGMGRVYRASQLRPERTVAVKLVRPGLTAELAQLRLENEASFLARLQHPGIAQIHLVGMYASDFGPVPYYVMEYVHEAKSLTAHADERSLDATARLKLFAQVCEAVAHGHERGVVHRDLKPGNILVDTDGHPKVIDFGIARSIGGELAAHAGSTRTGHLLGTLQYMSPEQFTQPSSTLDARSDVYALGVVLFELLTGELPYDVQNKPPHEVSRLICLRAPRHIPSRARGTRHSQGISDIVARCLEKSPIRRYADAGEIARAIRACLSGERVGQGRPFFARPKSLAGVAAFGAIAVLGVLMLRSRPEKPPGVEGSAQPRQAAAAQMLPLPPGNEVEQAGERTPGAALPGELHPARVDPVVGRWVSDDPEDRWVKEFRDNGDFFNREPDGAVHRGRWTRLEDGTVSVQLNGGWKMSCVLRGENLGVCQTTNRGVTGPEKEYRLQR